MLSWKQFTDYAAELQLKPEYVEQNREFFEQVDPAFFDRIFNADKLLYSGGKIATQGIY